MIIRKPYAFLIKNFRKIHILLLVLSIYVLYKLIQTSGFVNEFMQYGVYDMFKNPITNYISFFLTVSILLLIIGSLALLFLLNHKKKPWKLYLIPAVQYFALLLVLGMIKGFFGNYTSDVETTDLRLSRDLLMMFMVVQLPTIGIYAMRVFGLDIKKFKFDSDKEFLELSEEDREEVEIGLNIDKDSFIRGFKRTIRNLKYFYLEHKGICKILIGVFSVVIVFSLYKTIFITHKSYREGDYYSVNGFTFKVNNAYITDKDYKGEVIADKSNFVIIDITIKNNDAPRTIDLENFHIKNSKEDYITTREVFADSFKDLGKTTVSVKKLKRDETINNIIVYKVNKRLRKNKFVLYYQEKSGYLRKIKLNLKDISEVKKEIKLKNNDNIELNMSNGDVISFDNTSITKEVNYSIRTCGPAGCYFESEIKGAPEGYRILGISFASETWEVKNMIDFLTQYGKLKYRDSNDGEFVIDIVNPIGKMYYGKTVFIRVPVEVETAKEVYLDLVVRDNHYVYKII